jgi:hypothetical protein
VQCGASNVQRLILLTFITVLLTQSPFVSAASSTNNLSLHNMYTCIYVFQISTHSCTVFYCNSQDPRFMNAVTRMPSQSYIWDISNPNTPDVELLPPSPLCCLRYNPKSTDTLVSTSDYLCYNRTIYILKCPLCCLRYNPKTSTDTLVSSVYTFQYIAVSAV